MPRGPIREFWPTGRCERKKVKVTSGRESELPWLERTAGEDELQLLCDALTLSVLLVPQKYRAAGLCQPRRQRLTWEPECLRINFPHVSFSEPHDSLAGKVLLAPFPS